MFELPWVEKYRPTKISNIIGNKHIIERFNSFVNLDALPNIILTGPPGVGKTTAAFCLVEQILGENLYNNKYGLINYRRKLFSKLFKN